MAISFDAAVHNANVPITNTLTFSHTCSGSNGILFVGACCSGAQTITNITYNGVSLTKINSQAYVLGVSELWYLIAPGTGSNNIVITYSGSAPTADGCAISYAGAAQSGQPDSQGTATAVGNVTDTRTSIADNCWHVGFFANVSNNFSAGAGLTIRSGASNLVVGDNNGVITPAGSNSITGNNTGSSVVNGATFSPAQQQNSSFLMMF